MLSSETLNAPPAARWWRNLAWWPMALAAVAVALLAVPPYLTLDGAFSRVPLNERFDTHMLWLAMHAGPGGLALLLGPVQFLPGLRARRPRLHRVVGRAYLMSVAAGGLAAVVAGLASTSGIAAQVGLLLLALLWLHSGWRGLVAARARRIQEHRMWMVRNYSLTFSAVWLRLFFGLGQVAIAAEPAITVGEVYTAAVWASVILALLVADWLVLARLPSLGPNRRPITA